MYSFLKFIFHTQISTLKTPELREKRKQNKYSWQQWPFCSNYTQGNPDSVFTGWRLLQTREDPCCLPSCVQRDAAERLLKAVGKAIGPWGFLKVVKVKYLEFYLIMPLVCVVWRLSSCRKNFLEWKKPMHLSRKVKVKSLSRVPTFATPWTEARQAPLSVGFFRQEHWSGLPRPPPGDLPDLGIKPRYSALQADPLLSEPSYLNITRQIKYI